MTVALPAADAFSSESAYTPHVSEGMTLKHKMNFLSFHRCLWRGRCFRSNRNHSRCWCKRLRRTNYGSRWYETIWSPRSNISLYGETAPITLYDNFKIFAIGTDWVLSGSMNTNREKLGETINTNHYNSYFSYRDLWAMATINGAKAMNMEDKLGVLHVGTTRHRDIQAERFGTL